MKGIYKIENLLTGKKYIGQSIHIELRWQEHCRNSANSLIAKAIKKYGKENFSFEVLEEVLDESTLNDRETYYIQKFNSLAPNGYNVVLVDSSQHHQFNKYSFDTFNEIINDIKNSEKSFKEIAEDYSLDLSMIYYLNRGTYHKLPNESYPLRPVKDFSKKQHFCVDCGKEISKGAVRCPECDHKRQRKVERPSREVFKNLIRTESFNKIGKTYGVSDKTIAKWCDAYNLPRYRGAIDKYSNEKWEKI